MSLTGTGPAIVVPKGAGIPTAHLSTDGDGANPRYNTLARPLYNWYADWDDIGVTIIANPNGYGAAARVNVPAGKYYITSISTWDISTMPLQTYLQTGNTAGYYPNTYTNPYAQSARDPNYTQLPLQAMYASFSDLLHFTSAGWLEVWAYADLPYPAQYISLTDGVIELIKFA